MLFITSYIHSIIVIKHIHIFDSNNHLFFNLNNFCSGLSVMLVKPNWLASNLSTNYIIRKYYRL